MSVRFDPSADSEQVSNVVHLHLTGRTSTSEPPALFEGKVSSYYLGKIKHGEVPSALASRQVPVASWRSGAELVVAPIRPLLIGPYALVSTDGLLAEFKVAAVRPVLERLWPPATSIGSPLFAVYCRPDSSAAERPGSGSLVFEPGQVAVELAPGVDESGLFGERCSHFDSQGALPAGEIWVPPPAMVAGWALSPAVFSSVGLEAVDPVSCQSGELAFGLGCARVADDRLTVRTPNAPLLWVVHTARGALVEVSAPGRPLWIDGLPPDTQERLWGTTRDLTGATRSFELELHTAPARARPILNEVLADALGPEPESEWLELFNDGTLAADLGQYSLQDGGGRTPLPHESLASHEYALLVRDDFAANASDEPPPAGTRLIRLPVLGKSGLSNAGERLSLVDSGGVECSVLPALAGKPGQSLARRTPSSNDSDPKAFRFGLPTPGLPNEVVVSAP